METRAKSSADFRSEIHDILSGHETRINDIVATNDTRFAQHNTRFDQLVELITKSNNRLDQLANDMQALRLPHNQPVSSHIRPTTDREPHFHFRSTSNQDPTSFNTRERHTGETSHSSLAQHSNLKLNFPTYNGLDDPTGWIFKAEQYIHKVDDLPENFLVGSFISGLKDDIRLDVRVKQPRTLSNAISVAHLIEERNQLQKRPPIPFQQAVSVSQNRPAPSSTVGLLGPSPSQQANQVASSFQGPVRQITGQEARERREKGLCYYCDERFVPGHRCSRPQLFMIENVQLDAGIEDVDMELESASNDYPIDKSAQFHPCGQG